MKILFIGDIVGRPGRSAVRTVLPQVVSDDGVDLVVANAENATGGVGLTPETADELFRCGIHVLTGGNHTWRHRELYQAMERDSRILRPHNYAPGAPGSGLCLYPDPLNPQVAVVNLIGRAFMDPVDCPFRTADLLLQRLDQRVKHILVDLHCEATSEKAAMGWYLDGRVTAVVGTHTHVQTSDERILPKGTAYISDVGMCGPRDSVLGMKVDEAIARFTTGLPVRFSVASGECIFNGVVIECHSDGTASSIRRVSRVLPG